MNNLNQLILNFDHDQNFKDQDFYVSKSNEFAFKLLNSWPKWEKNFVNLIGENFSPIKLIKFFSHLGQLFNNLNENSLLLVT